MRAINLLPILLLAAAPCWAEDPLVVLAASRDGRIEVYAATTLAPLGAIRAGKLLESVSASPDGRRLYIAQEGGLFSLNLETRNMCLLSTPSLFGAPSPDGRFLFTQGDQGVEVINAQTLNRVSTMKAPGAYNLQPSPDGRWLLGVTNSPKPSLDVFDMNYMTLARRIPMPAGPVTGAWAGDRFYLLGFQGDPQQAWLWSGKPETGELSVGMGIGLPDLHGGCNEPVLLMMAGARGRLFLAEAFGFKVDRRPICPDAARGGIYAVDPSTGQVRQMAESVHVNRMVVTPDGHDLYLLESNRRNSHGNLCLLHVDTRMNREISDISLQSGEWNLALAHIPAALIPRGNVRVSAYCSH
jgi:hypothetical protein